jgi:hypothetical protein
MPRARIELPIHEFLYTLDQIAMILGIAEKDLRAKYIFFDGVTTGAYQSRMRARNIAQPTEKPDWRVPHSQLKLWLIGRRFSVVEARIT